MSCLSGARQASSVAATPVSSRNLDEVTPIHKELPGSYPSVVTGGAIDRNMLLPVTIDTKTHIQIYFAFRRGLLRHIAMAGGAALRPRGCAEHD